VDDFGTGYSSLSYLKNLPIDCLKIDRSFIHDMTRDPRDVALVRGIIGIAHSLSMRVVAEGVETQRQAEMLRSLGCDLAQGYYFHRPMSGTRCAELLIAAPSAPSFADTLTQPALKRVSTGA
jgi:Amt family ammonium transporter